MMIQEMSDTGFGMISLTGVEDYWIGFSKNPPAITRRISKSLENLLQGNLGQSSLDDLVG